MLSATMQAAWRRLTLACRKGCDPHDESVAVAMCEAPESPLPVRTGGSIEFAYQKLSLAPPPPHPSVSNTSTCEAIEKKEPMPYGCYTECAVASYPGDETVTPGIQAAWHATPPTNKCIHLHVNKMLQAQDALGEAGLSIPRVFATQVHEALLSNISTKAAKLVSGALQGCNGSGVSNAITGTGGIGKSSCLLAACQILPFVFPKLRSVYTTYSSFSARHGTLVQYICQAIVAQDPTRTAAYKDVRNIDEVQDALEISDEYLLMVLDDTDHIYMTETPPALFQELYSLGDQISGRIVLYMCGSTPSFYNLITKMASNTFAAPLFPGLKHARDLNGNKCGALCLSIAPLYDEASVMRIANVSGFTHVSPVMARLVFFLVGARAKNIKEVLQMLTSVHASDAPKKVVKLPSSVEGSLHVRPTPLYSALDDELCAVLSRFETRVLQSLATRNADFTACVLTELRPGEAAIDVALLLEMTSPLPTVHPLPAKEVRTIWESVSGSITMTGSAHDAAMLCPNLLFDYIDNTKGWAAVYPVSPLCMVLAMAKDAPPVGDVMTAVVADPRVQTMLSMHRGASEGRVASPDSECAVASGSVVEVPN